MDRSVKKKTLSIFISCIIGLAVGSGYLMRLLDIREDIAGLEESIPVLTASKTIDIGEKITAQILSTARIPRVYLPSRAILADDLELILGRPLIHPVREGDPIQWTDLPEGPRIRYSTEKIPAGYRALALPADEVKTLVHILSPGDRVDVLWIHYPDESPDPSSTILGEGIPIFAVGKWMQPENRHDLENDYPTSLTLLVNMNLALKISSAKESGQIVLLARGRGIS
jgi:pilus assembly protein CpaB